MRICRYGRAAKNKMQRVIALALLLIPSVVNGASCQESGVWPPPEPVQPYSYEYAAPLWWGGEAYNGWSRGGFSTAQEAWNWWLALHQQVYPTQTCSQVPFLGAGVGNFVQGWIKFLCRDQNSGWEWGGQHGEPVSSYCPTGYSTNLTEGTCEQRQACPSGFVDVGTGCSKGKEDGVCFYRDINGIIEKDITDPDCLQASCCRAGQVVGSSGNCIDDCPPNLIMNHDDSCVGREDKDRGEGNAGCRQPSSLD